MTWFLVGVISTLFFPCFVQESLTRRSLVHKLACIVFLRAARARLE